MIDCRLLPRPEMRTAIRPEGDGLPYRGRVSLSGTSLADPLADDMPRRPRGTTGGFAYHVLNRAVRRATLFESDWEYAKFEELISQGLRRVPLSLFAYCAMPNHWHLVLWCDVIRRIVSLPASSKTVGFAPSAERKELPLNRAAKPAPVPVPRRLATRVA